MARNGEHMVDEADIGSGEKNSADAETQKMIEQIPQRHSDSSRPANSPSNTPSRDQSSQGETA